MRILWKFEWDYDYLFQKKPLGVPLTANKYQNKGKRYKKSQTTRKEVKKQIFCNKGTQVPNSNMVNTPIYVCSWNDHIKSNPHLGSTKNIERFVLKNTVRF